MLMENLWGQEYLPTYSQYLKKSLKDLVFKW
jgi:hypothetical protein